MTSLVATPTLASVYGSPVADHEAKFERARKSIARERQLDREHDESLTARDRDILDAYLNAPEDWSDNAIARELGMNPSTMRSFIPKEKRRAQKRRARGQG